MLGSMIESGEQLSSTSDTMVELAFTALDSIESKSAKWISVEDQHPKFKPVNQLIEASDKVFLLSKGDIHVGWFKRVIGTGEILSEGIGFVPHDATHWLPMSVLPTPKI
jgi:hypothetical protein